MTAGELVPDPAVEGNFLPVLALFTDSVGERGVCLPSRGERALSGEGRPPEVGGDEDTGRGILLGV